MEKIKVGWGCLIIALLTINSSCVREGCMDEAAVNFDSKATKDDGSCTYLTNGDGQESQEKGNHTYSLITTEGDTLFFGEIPYNDGLARVGIDEDTGRYRLKWLLLDNNEPGLICGGEVYLNQNNQPQMSTISGNENDGNQISVQSLAVNGITCTTYEGTFSIEDFQLRNQLQTGGQRITATVVFDGVFVDFAEEYFSAKLKITFSN